MTQTGKPKSGHLPPEVLQEIAAGVPIDRGYAWVVVASSFLIHIIVGSCTRSIGILTVHYSEKYSRTYGESTLLLSVFMPVFRFSSPLASVVGSLLTIRTAVMVGGLIMSLSYVFAAFSPTFGFLCFTFGTLLGVGMGLIHVLATSYVNMYFYRYRGLAMGLLFSGASAGSFVGPLLMNYLIETYTLELAQLLMAGLCLQVCVFAALMTPKSFFKGTQIDKVQSEECIKLVQDSGEQNPVRHSNVLTEAVLKAWSTLRKSFHPFVELLRDPWYLLYALGCVISAQAMLTSFFLIPQYGKEIGLSASQCTWILFIQGFPDMISRSVMGAISDLPFVNLAFFAAMLTAGQGVSYLIAPLCPSFSGILIYAIVLAITGGPGGPMRVIVGGRLVKSSLLSALLGQTMLLQGITWLIAPRLFGVLRDYTGSWYIVFMVVSASSFLAAVLIAILNIPLQQRQQPALAAFNEDNEVKGDSTRSAIDDKDPPINKV